MKAAQVRLVRPLLPILSLLTARYIARHRGRLRPLAQSLPADVMPRLRGFFPDDLLSETRVIHAIVPSPFFYPLVRHLGLGEFPEMSAIGAITLVDLIAYPESLPVGTLFHELVHVTQYRMLGLQEFARQYVRGFVNGGGYEGIPLERQAYELQGRFQRNPRKLFSVADDVGRRFGPSSM